jgi:hypothetical protein
MERVCEGDNSEYICFGNNKLGGFCRFRGLDKNFEKRAAMPDSGGGQLLLPGEDWIQRPPLGGNCWNALADLFRRCWGWCLDRRECVKHRGAVGQFDIRVSNLGCDLGP